MYQSRVLQVEGSAIYLCCTIDVPCFLCKDLCYHSCYYFFAFLIIIILIKNTVRKFSFNESRSFISSGSSWKSNNWIFSRIHSSCMDFGITTRSCCKLQRIRTCVQVFCHISLSSQQYLDH